MTFYPRMKSCLSSTYSLRLSSKLFNSKISKSIWLDHSACNYSIISSLISSPRITGISPSANKIQLRSYFSSSMNLNREESSVSKDSWILGGSKEAMRPQTESYTHPDVVAAYTSGRPQYPTEIIQRILAKFKERPSDRETVAVDVGCGSGQFTRILASHFNKVIGIDPSEPQIAVGKENTTEKNVEYRLGSCSCLRIPDQSVDIVTVATALHRFTELNQFLREVDRCLKPGGIFIYFGLFANHSEPLAEANKIFRKYIFGKNYLGPYWSPEVNVLITDEYSTIPQLYEDSESFQIVDTSDYTISKVVELAKSMEPYGVMKDKDPNKLKSFMESMIFDLKSTFPASNENDSMESKFDFQIKYVGCISQKPQ